MKLTLDRNHVRNERGEAVASVPHTLGDESDRAMSRLLVGAVNLLPRFLEALRDHHDGTHTRRSFRLTFERDAALLAEGRALLEEVSMNQNE